MAPGGGAAKDSGGDERPSFHRASSVDEVSGQAPAIVSTFLSECFRADGKPVPPEISENQKQINKDVAHVIRDIGDRLANDASLNNLISQVVVTKDTAFDTFVQVGSQIFKDGIVNWGRIVTLFYFGYKLAVQVISQIPLIKMIIEWVCQFIKDRLAKWIFEQGGWVRMSDKHEKWMKLFISLLHSTSYLSDSCSEKGTLKVVSEPLFLFKSLLIVNNNF